VTAARASNGSTIVACIPTARAVTVNTGRLSGAANATWYDPCDGMSSPAGTSRAATGSRAFPTPGGNRAGDDDCLLVPRAHQRSTRQTREGPGRRFPFDEAHSKRHGISVGSYRPLCDAGGSASPEPGSFRGRSRLALTMSIAGARDL
jgi:hypothetical protein